MLHPLNFSSQTATYVIRTAPVAGLWLVRSQSGPVSVTLATGPIEDGWELLRPLILLVEREDDGWFLVSDDIFGLYGDAESLRVALRQYASSLIDHYEFLMRESERNDLVVPQMERIRKYVRPTGD